MTVPADLDIVIVNWNAGDLLRTCVASVARAAKETGIGVHVTVVDNASRDDSARGLAAECPVNVIWNDHNAGFARACNQGAAAATAPFLLFLNPDTEVTADALSAPLRFLQEPKHQDYGVCGIQLRDEVGEISRSCARFPNVIQLFCTSIGLAQVLPGLPLGIPMSNWDHWTSRDVDHVIGAYYVIRRDLFARLGGFDERYFVYLEDLDLSLRVAKAGFRTHYLASTWAQHIGGGTSRQVKARRLYYSIESRLKYIRRHFGVAGHLLFWPLVMLVEPIIRVTVAAAKLQGSTIKEVLAAYRMLWKGEGS